MHVAVDLLHAFRSEVAFGNHLHLYLCALHGVALAYHGSEGAVAAEVGISRYEQVAQIYRVVDITLHRVNGSEEAVHLLHGIRHEDGLEVVAVFQSAADACGNGIYVFQYRRVFYADDIA